MATSQPNPTKASPRVLPNMYGIVSNAFIMAIEPLGREGQDRKPKTIYLPYVPDELAFSRSAEYQKTPIQFGTEKTLFYKQTSPIQFNLDWTYVAGVNLQDGTELMSTTQLLHSMVCPGSKTKEAGILFGDAEYERPGVVWVVIGTWLRLRCVIEEVKLTYRGPWGSARADQDPSQMTTFNNSGLFPKVCDCNVSFEATQFYDAHKGVTTPGKVQTLPEAAKRVGAKALRNRDYIRSSGLSNIIFSGQVR